MFTVSRRISFSVVIAVIVGWGIFFILFIQSAGTLLSSSTTDQGLTIMPSVRLRVQIDKRVYVPGDAVLVAVRNDSRVPIYVQQAAAGCPTNWWSIEQLQADGEHWESVLTTKQTCSTPSSMIEFPKHTLRSDQWQTLVPGSIGDVLVDAPSGTYRVVVPYVKGKSSVMPTWPESGFATAVSPTFSIQ